MNGRNFFGLTMTKKEFDNLIQPRVFFGQRELYPKRIVFITDVKFDDLLALFLGYLKMAKEHGSEGTIDIVITNVYNTIGAKNSVNDLFNSINCVGNKPRVRYIKGVQIEANEAKIYEKYFHESKSKKWDVIQSTPNENYYLYIFAPFPQPLIENYININAFKIFVGLGYNTEFLEPEKILEIFEEYRTLNNSKNIIIMNNQSKTIYPFGGGGMFSSDENNEIWESVGSVTNFFKDNEINNAKRNSKEFAIKQINKLLVLFRKNNFQGVPKNLDKDLQKNDMENWKDLEIYLSFIDKNIENLKNNLKEIPRCIHYYERIKNQINAKGWEVECTDGQCMALWLNNDLQNVNLSLYEEEEEEETNKKYIDIKIAHEETGYYAPTNLNKIKVKEIFIKMVNELGENCKKPSGFGKKTQKRKTYKGYTLVSIKKSTNSGKKYMATFKHTKTGRTKTTHFGATGYQDFRQHRDPQRKQRYINRHKKRENWKDPMTPGALSLYILWNKPTLKASIADYKRRFF